MSLKNSFKALIIIVTLTIFISCEKKYHRIIAVDTGGITNINASGGEIDAMVVDAGESGLTEHGWCIGKNTEPTIENNKVNNGSKNNYGAFSNILSGLESNTHYYIRPYVSSGETVAYGTQLEFDTHELNFMISNPQSSGILGIGLTYNIEWEANINDRLSISLVNDGGFSKKLIDDVENSEVYSWTLTNDIPEGDNYNIIIKSSVNDIISEASGSFQISSNVAPNVFTTDIININYFTTEVQGLIVDFGTESNVSQHGHCWATNENPTTLDNATQLGARSTTGDFTSNLTNLNENTTYYVRAYVTTPLGIAYGEQKTFITLDATYATVSTSEMITVSYLFAAGGGVVSNENGYPVTAKGVCWSTNHNPTIADNLTTDGSGTGVFSSNLISLIANTQYYIRAYATNQEGTSYGVERTFTTSTFGSVTDYDGNNYKTVQIGNQVWMAENLKVTHFPNGGIVPFITNDTDWGNLGDNNTDKAYCIYNDNANNELDTYGALYSWAAAMNGSNSSSSNPSGVQGICPTGWHLPSSSEWQELIDLLGYSTASAKLKEAGTVHLQNYNLGATNATGFTSLPGGLRFYTHGGSGNIKESGYWWSTTEQNPEQAIAGYMYYDHSFYIFDPDYKSLGLSVRCIKD